MEIIGNRVLSLILIQGKGGISSLATFVNNISPFRLGLLPYLSFSQSMSKLVSWHLVLEEWGRKKRVVQIRRCGNREAHDQLAREGY